MKFYIASKLENHEQVVYIRNKLTALGHRVTYDWTAHGPVYKQGLERLRQVAHNEAYGVMMADFIVVLWPGGRGTHVELGIALGAEKPVIFMSEVIAHHKATEETCAFYHHPLVHRVKHTDHIERVVYTIQRGRLPQV